MNVLALPPHGVPVANAWLRLYVGCLEEALFTRDYRLKPPVYVRVTPGAARSVGFDKCVMSCLHYYGIALQILCAPPFIPPLFP